MARYVAGIASDGASVLDGFAASSVLDGLAASGYTTSTSTGLVRSSTVRSSVSLVDSLAFLDAGRSPSVRSPSAVELTQVRSFDELTPREPPAGREPVTEPPPGRPAVLHAWVDDQRQPSPSRVVPVMREQAPKGTLQKLGSSTWPVGKDLLVFRKTPSPPRLLKGETRKWAKGFTGGA